jgi:hypothetical protein
MNKASSLKKRTLGPSATYLLKAVIAILLSALAAAGCGPGEQNESSVKVDTLQAPETIQTGSPSFEMSETSWYFGMMPSNTVVRHDFWIRNVGDAPMRVTEVWPNCECTSYELSDIEIDAKDSARLAVYFDSEGIFRDTDKEVTVRTTDTSHYYELIGFSALVNIEHRLVKARPRKLDFGSVIGSRDQVEGEVMIVNEGDEPVEIKLAAPPPEFFTAELAASRIDPHDSLEIAIQMVAFPDEPLRVRSSFTVEFGSEHRDRITVPLTVQYRP